MFRMTKAIYDTLNTKTDLHVYVEERGDISVARLPFKTQDGRGYNINFISSDDGNDVSVRVYGLLNVESSKTDKFLPIINKLNSTYRFVTFVLADNGDINIEYDYLTNCPDPTASAEEIVCRFANIIDDVYPELMRAKWI